MCSLKCPRLPCILIGAIAVLTIGATAIAQPATQSDSTADSSADTSSASSMVRSAAFTLSAAPGPSPGPNSVNENLAEAAAKPPGILKYGPVSILDRASKDLNAVVNPMGLTIGFAYTALYQGATGGPGIRDAAGQDADVFGNWRLLGPKDGQNNGYLYFAGEWRGDMGTDIAPAALGGQIGSLWGTTNGFGEQPFTLKECYWEQHVGGDNLIVRVGKLDPENYYNSNYWQSDTKYFLMQTFSSFPVRAFPGQGLGMNVTAKLSDQWYISTGFQDAEGQKTTAGFNTFFDDFNLFSAFEIGYTPDIQGIGKGTYRLTAWYRDAGDRNGEPHDAGIDLSIDQRIGDHLRPFFRYGAGEGNIKDITQLVSTGVGWEGKLITESDVVGIAGSWGRPSDRALRDQFGAEVFYRLQVSPDNQLTVGYQVIVDPSNQPNDNVVGVFEIRWRVAI